MRWTLGLIAEAGSDEVGEDEGEDGGGERDSGEKARASGREERDGGGSRHCAFSLSRCR